MDTLTSLLVTTVRISNLLSYVACLYPIYLYIDYRRNEKVSKQKLLVGLVLGAILLILLVARTRFNDYGNAFKLWW